MMNHQRLLNDLTMSVYYLHYVFLTTDLHSSHVYHYSLSKREMQMIDSDSDDHNHYVDNSDNKLNSCCSDMSLNNRSSSNSSGW